jgi:mono/diheme cytochrome c family protein
VNSKRRLAVAVVLAGAASGACSWLSDFRQQPSVGTWQSLDQAGWSDTTTPFRANPQGSVPTTGTALAAYQVSYRPLPNVIDSMASLANPVPATQASVDRGWKYFQINCSVCHGATGDGAGVVRPFFLVAPSLLVPPGSDRSDGYVFGMMRNGRGLMPSMNRISEEDRWHVVNYVRGLQGRLPADITVQRESPGLPGVTGDALPGATRLGPTVPSVHVRPVYTPTGGAPPAAGGHE